MTQEINHRGLCLRLPDGFVRQCFDEDYSSFVKANSSHLDEPVDAVTLGDLMSRGEAFSCFRAAERRGKRMPWSAFIAQQRRDLQELSRVAVATEREITGGKLMWTWIGGPDPFGKECAVAVCRVGKAPATLRFEVEWVLPEKLRERDGAAFESALREARFERTADDLASMAAERQRRVQAKDDSAKRLCMHERLARDMFPESEQMRARITMAFLQDILDGEPRTQMMHEAFLKAVPLMMNFRTEFCGTDPHQIAKWFMERCERILLQPDERWKKTLDELKVGPPEK